MHTFHVYSDRSAFPGILHHFGDEYCRGAHPPPSPPPPESGESSRGTNSIVLLTGINTLILHLGFHHHDVRGLFIFKLAKKLFEER